MRLKRLLSGKASVEVAEEKGVRTLHLGGDAIQSAMRLSAPDRLELAYTRAMLSALLFKEAPRDILMIGLGGGSIARFAHRRMPASRMTVVEINPRVVAAARSFFGVPMDDERFQVEIADGGSYVRAHPASCDLLLLDAFDDGRSVKSLATQSFYEACYACLRPGGVFSVNFIEDEPRFPTYLKRIESAFNGRVLVMPSEDRVNNIVLAIKDGPVRFAIENLKRQGRALKRRYELPFDVFVRNLLAHNGRSSAYLRVGLSAET